MPYALTTGQQGEKEAPVNLDTAVEIMTILVVIILAAIVIWDFWQGCHPRR